MSRPTENRIRHLRTAAITFAAALAVFWIAAFATYYAMRELVSMSPFRLATAMSAGQFADHRVSLVVGDSRMMDGVNAAGINEKLGRRAVFNAAFNGVELPEAMTIVDGFVDTCRCQLDKVLIDETALWEEAPGVSETEVFLAAFNSRGRARLRERDPRKATVLEAVPAVYFNNEVTLRSLYYLAKRGDDQDHGNTYRFRVPKNRVAQIGREAKVNNVKVESVHAMVERVRSLGGTLIVVIPPHHPVYTEGRIGYAEYVESVRQVAMAGGAGFQDDSRHFVDRPEYFSDLIHLHVDGQEKYSDYLLDRLFR